MADPYFANVVLLAVNDSKAAGVTTFLDQSTYARTLTTVGNTAYSTAQFPTGLTSSAILDGTGDYITAADAVELEPGAGDFTIEAWVYVAAANDAKLVTAVCKSVAATSFGPWLIQRSSTTWNMFLSSTGLAWNIASTQNMGNSNPDVWEHVAISRVGSDIRSFVNGVAGAAISSSATLVDNAAPLCVGSINGAFGQELFGHVASVRYTVGVGRYTADFTPPALPFPITATDPPVANFTGTPLSGKSPLTVQFTDTSTNTPTSWLWDFGDGQTSTAQNPSHVYANTGTYTVSLTATNAGGSDVEVKSGYITSEASGGGDSTRLRKRGRRPKFFWQQAIENEKKDELAEAMFDAVADAYMINGNREFVEQVNYIANVESRLRAAKFYELADQLETSLKDLAYKAEMRILMASAQEEAELRELMEII